MTERRGAPAHDQSLQALSDGDLGRLVLAGDTAVFGILVQRHQDALYRLAWAMVQDRDVASDLVQDALIRAFVNLDRCRDVQRFRVWLMTTLRNRCLDYLKDRRRQDVPLDGVADVRPGSDTDPLDTLAARTELERALGALPATLREAFLLRHVEDMDYEDMAELLETTVAGVKMRVSRAREALRQQLAAAGRELEHRDSDDYVHGNVTPPVSHSS
jgi:RNA polymerase sigma factor (sigma-70 family)